MKLGIRIDFDFDKIYRDPYRQLACKSQFIDYLLGLKIAPIVLKILGEVGNLLTKYSQLFIAASALDEVDTFAMC